MAMKLIDQLTGDFDISKYKDTYTETLDEVYQGKSKRQKIYSA